MEILSNTLFHCSDPISTAITMQIGQGGYQSLPVCPWVPILQRQQKEREPDHHN